MESVSSHFVVNTVERGLERTLFKQNAKTHLRYRDYIVCNCEDQIAQAVVMPMTSYVS